MIKHIIPIISTILYFNFPKNIVVEEKYLYTFSLLHNIILSLFSLYIFIDLFNFYSIETHLHRYLHLN